MHRLDLGLYSHPKEFGGMESEPMLIPNKKNPLYRRLKEGSNPRCCVTQDSEPNTPPTELFRPPTVRLTMVVGVSGRLTKRPVHGVSDGIADSLMICVQVLVILQVVFTYSAQLQVDCLRWSYEYLLGLRTAVTMILIACFRVVSPSVYTCESGASYRLCG